MSFCAAGNTSTAAEPEDGFSGSASGSGDAFAVGSDFSFGSSLGSSLAGLEAAPPAPAARCPSNAPTSTSSPSATIISSSRPDSAAFTSRVTLSVSSSRSGSSFSTASPTLLNHCPTVASVTDSPSAGTRISTVILISYSDFTPRASSTNAFC